MIRFKLKFSIQELSLGDNEIDFELTMTHKVKIRLSKPDREYLEQSKNPYSVFCEAELTLDPSEKQLEQFARILDNKIVTDTHGLKSYSKTRNAKGEEIIIPPLSHFPEYFRDFINQVFEELSESIKRTIMTVRWVCDNRGRHNPFSMRGFQWTRDDINWYSAPTTSHISVEMYSHEIEIGKWEKGIIHELLAAENIEPIYHSLFREAWEQKSQNPRSSLILAISSIEVSLKYLIERVAPDAAWLMKNLQSPPIEKIFREYLPKLAINNKVKEVSIALTEETLMSIKKWVGIRNQLTHLGTKSLSGDELNEMLLTVKDILHIIDFYSGHRWSINYVRESTLEKMGLK